MRRGVFVKSLRVGCEKLTEAVGHLVLSDRLKLLEGRRESVGECPDVLLPGTPSMREQRWMRLCASVLLSVCLRLKSIISRKGCHPLESDL